MNLEPGISDDSGQALVDHPVGPEMVQALLRNDLVSPPETLLEASSYRMGSNPIDVERYTSRAFYDLEVRKLWPRVWQFACWTGDIPNAGDIYVYRNVGQSVLVVRQREGAVRAFVNSCLHRGRELCDDHTSQLELRCPYHGFTWKLNGTLRSIPSRQDFPQIEDARFNLPEIRVEEWNGFYFINFDEQAPSLVDYLGSMVDQWKDWDFSKKYKAVHVEITVDCNWKATMDAFIEAFHVFASHPQFTPFVADANGQYDVYPDEPHFSRFHIPSGQFSPHLSDPPSEQEMIDCFLQGYLPEVLGTPEGDLLPGESARQGFARIARRTYQERLRVDLSRMPETELLDGTEYFVFPHFMPWPSLANPIVYRFRPADGPDRCIWETMLFLPFEGEMPIPSKVIKLPNGGRMDEVAELGYLGPVLQQDLDNFAAVQRGMKASATQRLELAEYQEIRIRHYHETIDRYLRDAI